MPQDTCQKIEVCGINESTMMMSLLWPWIRKQDKGAINTSIGKSREQHTRIIIQYSNVIEFERIDFCERRGHPGHERFTADKADVGIALSLCCQMFASTKPDLQPNILYRLAKY